MVNRKNEIDQLYFKIKKVVLSYIDDNSTNPQIEPALPVQAPDFTEGELVKLQVYQDEVCNIKTFEEFMSFVEKAIVDLQKNPATDYPKIAAIFNGYRLARNLQPL